MQAIRNFVDAILYPFRMLARIPSRVISSPRRMLGLSLPVRSALLLFLGLLLIFIIWVAFNWLQADDRLQFEVFIKEKIWVPITLVFVIPLIAWYALKLWLEGESSPFPEIDRVWNAALAAMKEQSINPSDTPIFLILGPSSTEATNAFMAASHAQFPVALPSGPAAAHVYANQQSIYIVCTQSCCLGYLLGDRISTTGVGVPSVPASSFDPARTMQVGVTSLGISEPAAQPAPSDRLGLGGIRVPGGVSNAPADIGGTMLVGAPNGLDQAFPAAPQAPPVGHLDSRESGVATAKLAYLCRCIRRVRDPVCPINGVLVTTPFGILADGTQDAVNQLQTALKLDLAAIRGASRVRCSVTHIIDGMEQEAGFRELIRRVGPDRAGSQRFGKGFGLWNLPTPDQLDALIKHACGAFEDWAYLLFREEDGLTKRGNRNLYGLLCRIRTNFSPRLRNLIQASYAIDRDASSIANREPLLFSGCYFVANGATRDRQAFLASVFRKSQGEEEELEWGGEALSEEHRMQSGVRILLVINGILIAFIVFMFLMKWLGLNET